MTLPVSLSRIPRWAFVLLVVLIVVAAWAASVQAALLSSGVWLGAVVTAALAGLLAYAAHPHERGGAPATGSAVRRERLLEVVDALPWSLLLTEDGKILHANPSAHRFLGVETGALLGAEVLGFVEPDNLGEVRAWMEQAAQTTLVPSLNAYLRVASGEVVPVRLQGANVEYGSRRVLEILLSDRSEEHRARAEVERLATFPHNNPDPIVEVRPDNTLRYVNPAAHRALPALVEREAAHPFLHTLPALRTALREGAEVATATIEAEGKQYEQVAILDRDGETVRIYGRDVTRREQVVKSLHQSEDRFARVFHLSPVAMSVSRLDDGTLLDVNESMAQLLGYKTPSELVGRTSSEVVWHDEKMRQRVADLLRNHRRMKPRLVTIRTRTGAVRHAIGSAELIEVDGVPCISGMLIDVEEQERLRMRVEEERDFALSIIETTGMGLVINDADYRVQYVNQALLNMTGYTEEEVLGSDPMTFLHLADQHKVADTRSERREDARGKTYDARVRRKDGSYFDVLIAIVPRIENGTYAGTTSVVIDVTEQRQATREVERLRFFYENILHDLPIDLAVMDSEGRFLFVNERAVHMPELRKQLIGKTALDYARLKGLDLGLYEKRQAWLEEVIRTREDGELEEVFERDDGPRVILRMARPVLDPNGEVSYVVGYGLDVTDRKRSEAELIRARDQAEELSELKSSFIANMSHEVRTPLTAVIGFAEVLQEEIEAPELREVAVLIRESGSRLLETLNSVLELARIQAGVVELRLYPVTLAPLLKTSVELFRPLAEQKGLALHFGAPAEPISVQIDIPAFNRILNNLLSNAIKFTAKGEVRLTLQQSDTQVFVRVADTGPGIDDAFLERVFEEFQQESSGLSRSHQGTGLGLPIARHLAEMMRGTVTVQSRKGEGAVFTLTLPKYTGNEGENGEGAR